jgi:anti-sigma regulatory factor (Ser/Thr protein kinase)
MWRLAVTEVCSNAVRYAYPTGPGDILLEVDITGDAVIAIGQSYGGPIACCCPTWDGAG